jgi:V/A-type H+-transporting ATPase subunit C
MLFAGSGGNYAYSCARVKAKKQFLLSQDTYSRLLVMDVHEIGRFLGETQYKEEITRFGSKYSGASLIEVAVTRNLGQTYMDILGYTTGHLNEMVGYYLHGWDIFNVKTILRGKVSHVRDDEIIDTLVPAGSLSEEYLKSIVALGTLQEIMDSLSKVPALRIAPDIARDVIDSGRLAAFEDYLDKNRYYDLLKVVSPTNKADALLRQFLRREIDATNLKVLLKMRADRLPEELIAKYLIPGGMEFTLETLRALASAEGLSPILEELEQSETYKVIKPAIDQFRGDKKLSTLTVAIDKAALRTSEKFAHFYPLSILPIINYMIQKKVEVDNIRIIARGKQSALASKIIEELLVV